MALEIKPVFPGPWGEKGAALSAAQQATALSGAGILVVANAAAVEAAVGLTGRIGFANDEIGFLE